MKNAKMKKADDFVFIYSCFPSVEAARRASIILLDKKFIACVNLFPGGLSLYRWEGKINEEGEVYCFFKTRRSLIDQASTLIKEHHPYDVPALVVLNLEQADESYLNWLKDNINNPS